MGRFYHSLSGLATPSTSGLYAYSKLSAGGAGRYLRRRYWFRQGFNRCVVCRELVKPASIDGAWGDWTGASRTRCPKTQGGCDRRGAPRRAGSPAGLATSQTTPRRWRACVELW
jgi:hypothetical protein